MTKTGIDMLRALLTHGEEDSATFSLPEEYWDVSDLRNIFPSLSEELFQSELAALVRDGFAKPIVIEVMPLGLEAFVKEIS